MTRKEFTDKIEAFEKDTGKKICDRHLHSMWEKCRIYEAVYLDVLFNAYLDTEGKNDS